MPSQLPDLPSLSLLETDEKVGRASVAGHFEGVIRAVAVLRFRRILVIHHFLNCCPERWLLAGGFS